MCLYMCNVLRLCSYKNDSKDGIQCVLSLLSFLCGVSLFQHVCDNLFSVFAVLAVRYMYPVCAG